MTSSVIQLMRENKCFAFFRLPNNNNLKLLISDSTETLNNLRELNSLNGFIMTPFNTDLEKKNSHPIILIKPSILLDDTNYINYLLKKSMHEESQNKKISFDIIEDKEKYEIIFNIFHDQLNNNNFSKLVLSRECKIRLDENAPIATLFNKALQNENCFVYLCHTPQTGTWLGCSPELLLRNRGNKWNTVSLAGTRKNININTDWDEKNKKEQDIVTQYIMNILNKFSSDVHKSKTFTSIAGSIQHLKTDFSFTLKDSDLEKNKLDYLIDLINELFPTPAVCGLPKDSAREFIAKHEGYTRGYYSGIIGYLTPNKIDLFVNIRCMKISNRQVSLFAGGGLLPSSDMETEWKETQNKMQAMISLL